jgi:chemotaxis protein CheD
MVGIESVVNMGECAASRTQGDVLASIGLGSCIGLALVDPTQGVAGLAHIMLPDSKAGGGAGADGCKFADVAVLTLIERVTSLGATRARLEAVLVGGAQMFSFGGERGFDIGARNERAARDALGLAGITVRATATSGTKGRTIRVYVTSATVTVREAGGQEEELFGRRPKESEGAGR